MGERGFRKKTDYTVEGWEESEFPVLCETCLGNNPYVRMMKLNFGSECHICSRPYTAFRWKAGQDARYKKTVLCQKCSREKNVCQCCILDLTYGLPVQVRDTFVAHGAQSNSLVANASKVGLNDDLLKIARTQPYYQRNLPKICSFFARGECVRGTACPYRHELPDSDPALANQDYKKRYFGQNDPVAGAMLARTGQHHGPPPPPPPPGGPPPSTTSSLQPPPLPPLPPGLLPAETDVTAAPQQPPPLASPPSIWRRTVDEGEKEEEEEEDVPAAAEELPETGASAPQATSLRPFSARPGFRKWQEYAPHGPVAPTPPQFDVMKCAHICGIICSVAYIVSAILCLVYFIMNPRNVGLIISMLLNIVWFSFIASLEAPELMTCSCLSFMAPIAQFFANPFWKAILYFVIALFGFVGFSSNAVTYLLTAICSWVLFFIYLYIAITTKSGPGGSSSTSTTKTTKTTK